jgi:SagB-type dehydrogenase family enzyme
MTLPTPLEQGWHAAHGVSILHAGATGVRVGLGPSPPLALQPPTAPLADALVAIAEGVTEADLQAWLDVTEQARFHRGVDRLVAHGMVSIDVLHDGDRLASLVPRRRGFQLPLSSRAGEELELSRFAYLRRVGTELVLAAPDASCDVAVCAPQAQQWVTACAGPQLVEGDDPARTAFLRLLHGLQLLVPAGEVEPSGMRTWEFHDRLFHRAARSYDDHRVRGGTYRWRGLLDSPAPTRPAYAGLADHLPPPDPAGPSRPLRKVTEARRSNRDMSGAPVTRAEVSELLFRVARTTESLDGQDPLIRRPYPSGGSRHELEFYIAVRSCQGLDPDLYHYQGGEHSLVALGAPEMAAVMVDHCGIAWGQPDLPPQVLVVISSRLPRLSWKYEGIAYKLSLMNAGVAIANLYLVTEDMGLAGSAAGSGNPDLFAAATGADSWEETSIAEFGFGRAGG